MNSTYRYHLTRRERAARQRDVAWARVRGATVGTLTVSVAAAAVGAVVLAAPSTPSATTYIAPVSGGATGALTPGSGTPAGTAPIPAAATQQAPVALTGGS